MSRFIRNLEELGIKVPFNAGIHRCLKRIIENDYRDTVSRCCLSKVTLAADAAMLSVANLTELERLGYSYVVGSRIAKTPYAIEEYLKDPQAELEDMQIFDSHISTVINGNPQKRRVVYQYRQKRASLDLRNIEKVLTNLDILAQQVIDIYHRLFQVEKSFRMSKSDLKARPVFHHTKDLIKAHLTTVFAALAISRSIEAKTNLSIKKFVKTLRPIRTSIISVNNVEHELRPRIIESVKGILDSLP